MRRDISGDTRAWNSERKLVNIEVMSTEGFGGGTCEITRWEGWF